MSQANLPASISGSNRRPRRTYWLLLAIMVISTAWSLLWVGLFSAPARDEGHYVLLGWRCTLGERIYVDFYDGAQKPPLMYWMAGAAVKLIGRSAAVFPCLRMLTILVKTATLLLIFLIGKTFASRFAGLLGAALFGFHALTCRVGNQVMTEPYSTLFGLLGFWVFLKSQGQFGRGHGGPADVNAHKLGLPLLGPFLAGILLGVGTLYRPTPLFLAPVIGIALLIGRGTWWGKLRSLALFAGGVLVGILPLLAYLARSGAFHNFYVMVFRFMNAYPPVRYSLNHRWMRLERSFVWPRYYGWLSVLAVGVGLIEALRKRSQPWLVMGGWLGLQLIMTLVLRRVEWHYHYELLPGFVLLFAWGFQRLLRLARNLYAGLRPKERIQWLLAGPSLPAIVTIALLPICVWVFFFRIQSVALSWRAGLDVWQYPHGAELMQMGKWCFEKAWRLLTTWGVGPILLGSFLMIRWKNRYKYHIFLLAMGLCTLAMLSSVRGYGWATLCAGPEKSLCFTFALVGWLWYVGGALRRWAARRSPTWQVHLVTRLAHRLGNCLLVSLWFFFFWLYVGQAAILVKESTGSIEKFDAYPTGSRLEQTERAADYIRGRLLAGNEMLSTRADIIFLVGKPFPTYWGASHEEAAAKLGISEMVGRELADMPCYFEKHNVQFVVFAAGEPGLSWEGERYLQQHFSSHRADSLYVIYERNSVAPAQSAQQGR